MKVIDEDVAGVGPFLQEEVNVVGRLEFDGGRLRSELVAKVEVPGLLESLQRIAVARSRALESVWPWNSGPEARSLEEIVDSAIYYTELGKNVWALAAFRLEGGGIWADADTEEEWEELRYSLLGDATEPSDRRPAWQPGLTLSDDDWLAAVEGRIAGSLFLARDLLADPGVFGVKSRLLENPDEAVDRAAHTSTER